MAVLVEVPDLEPDWTSVGLVLAIAGSFLLANAMLVRRPRDLVRERLGRPGAPLVAIREHIFHRLQVGLGFAYLLAGFALQLFGRIRPPVAEKPGFPVFWVACIALATVAIVVLGWSWSSQSFRRVVRAELKKNPPDFESDMPLAREVGELFGVDSEPEDTIESFTARLRRELGIAVPARRTRAAAPEPDEHDLDDVP